MTDEPSWDEEIYEQVFDDIYAYVEKRKQDDTTFTLKDLRRMVDEAYQRRGMDWKRASAVHLLNPLLLLLLSINSLNGISKNRNKRKIKYHSNN